MRTEPALVAELFDFVNKRADIFKLSVNRGEPDVGNLIHFFQAVHDDFANLGAFHLRRTKLVNVIFNVIDELFEAVCRNRPFVARTKNTPFDLAAVIRFAVIVLLDHDQGNRFNFFIRRETLLAV